MDLSDRRTRQRLNARLRGLGVPAQVCNTCFVVRGIDAYATGSRRCRPCDAARKAMKRAADPLFRQAERKRHSEYMKARRRDPETRELVRAQGRAAQAAYRQTEEARAYYRDLDRARRARKAAATVEPFTEADLMAAWDAADYSGCYWCDGPFSDDDPLHLDHLVPLALGGPHSVDNLVPAHASCNTEKGAKDPYVFALERYPWLVGRYLSVTNQGTSSPDI